MSGNEVVKRAQDAYAVGLIDLYQLERFLDLGLWRGDGEVDVLRTLSLPFPWQIEDARKAQV